MPHNSRQPSLLYRAAAEELRRNEAQWEAYESTGDFVVLAGPGSGKTKVLTIKMARMLGEDVRPPRGVACITFNAECARELSNRMSQLGVGGQRNVFIGTVHGFCLKHLVRPFASLAEVGLPANFAVAGAQGQENALQRALDSVLDRQEDARWYRTRFDRYRTTHLDRTQASWRDDDAEVASVIERYEELLHADSLIDFDDMTLGGLHILQSQPWAGRAIAAKFPILLIDEYQDLGVPLHEIVMMLKANYGVRIFAVGDPDQSIYAFTGAQPELLTELAERDDVESVRLKLNYRSRRAIVRGAKIVIQEERDYEAVDAGEGLVEFVHCPNGLEQQATTIVNEVIPSILDADRSLTPSDIAVLYINQNIGNEVANVVAAKGWSYTRIDRGAPYPKTPFTRWLEDCAAWCAGGWKTGKPSLKSIVDTWRDLRGISSSRADRWKTNVTLIRFLWRKRDSTDPLTTWLEEFSEAVLGHHVGDGTTHLDDREAWRKVTGATETGRPLDGYTISHFGRQAGDPEQLNLITLHSSKGSEFSVVIMMGMDQGIIPRWNAGPGEEREQRRLFYVGLTRAKHEVYMMYSGFTVDARGGIHANGPSQFLLELQEQLQEDD